MAEPKKTTNQLAILKADTIDIIAAKVRQFQEHGELHLPANYSPENAMKSAWLMLQSTVDKDKKPVLQSCTKDSIANSLLDMVVQGLNPAKNQGYFIAYNGQLVFHRSYFGTMNVTKEVDDTIQEIIPEVVYEGDVFKYKIVRGKKEITEHEQTLESVDSKKVKAAYCLIIDQDGQIVKTEIMTFEEIKQAWKQSPMHPVDEKGNLKAGSTHDKFIAEMCKKTVINKTCKPIINASNDSHLFKKAVNRSSEIQAEEELSEDIAANANSEDLDIDAEYAEGAGEDQPQDPPAQDIPKADPPATGEAEQMTLGATGTEGKGPGF
jgi:recombination protein RecT